MMSILQSVNEREEFQVWRKRNRVRLKDIAIYCGCSISTISMWENGLSNICNETYKRYNEYIKAFEERKIYADNQKY